MKPTQQEIIELAREASMTVLPDETLWWAVHQDELERFATLLLERFGAGDGEPVARLMKWIGKGAYPKKGYTVARTYEECPKDAYPDYWEENQELYTHPSPTDLQSVRDRALDDAAAICRTYDCSPRMAAAEIEALKGKQ